MRTFTGVMDTSEQPTDTGFRVKLYLTDKAVEVATFDGDAWKWPAADVAVARLRPDRFRVDLGDEALYFTPDDPLGFLQQTSPAPQSTEPSQPKTGWLRRRIEEAAESPVEVDAPSYEPAAEDGNPTAGRFGLGTHKHTLVVTTGGGVTRRRCTECGHVSIDLSAVSSSLEAGALPA